ncbi:MAG: hypothetical protein ABIT04_10430 [Novosphingobium sp.]
MSKGNEIPFRRDQHARDTGSLVLDQHRKSAVAETGADASVAPASGRKPAAR